jgi:hypothetical protein
LICVRNVLSGQTMSVERPFGASRLRLFGAAPGLRLAERRSVTRRRHLGFAASGGFAEAAQVDDLDHQQFSSTFA